MVLTSTANPKLPPVFRADEVRINLGLRELLQGNFRIQEGSVTNPFFHAIIGKDGRDNLPRPQKTGGGETQIWIENLTLTNGRVQYEDARRDIFLNLPVWRAELQNQNVTFETRQPGTLRYEGRQAPVSNIAGQFTYDFSENRASIRRLAIAAAGSNVVLSGDIGRLAQPVLDLKAEGRLAIRPATRLAGIDQDVAGELAFNADITGPPANLKVDAAVKGDDLAYQEFKGVDLTSQLLYDAAANVLRAAVSPSPRPLERWPATPRSRSRPGAAAPWRPGCGASSSSSLPAARPPRAPRQPRQRHRARQLARARISQSGGRTTTNAAIHNSLGWATRTAYVSVNHSSDLFIGSPGQSAGFPRRDTSTAGENIATRGDKMATSRGRICAKGRPSWPATCEEGNLVVRHTICPERVKIHLKLQQGQLPANRARLLYVR